HDRDQYLQRPDLGRRLDAPSAQRLRDHATVHPGGADVALVVADGLSALAVHRHAAPLIACVVDGMRAQGWSMAPIALVEQGRVAVADEVGERLGARMVVILIGERPGLSSPDSLGLYFTYAPRVGLTDAARNCISNVRPEGLGYAAAAHKLLYLMREAWRRQVSGIQLKEAAEVPLVQGGRRNFLLD
ncbi:ethanolamine ammonia-lyase subunit EutC, partial [Ralstonia solanacearum]